MKVLYVTDGFPAAEKARRLLAGFADRDRVEITAMSVTHKGLPAPKHLLVTLDPIAGRREDTKKIVEAAVEELRAQGFRTSGRTGEGHPGEEILKAVEDDSYDVTVMGAGSRSWLGHFLLGSVSTRVLHASPTSVLIVHEAEAASPARILVGTDGSNGSKMAVEVLIEMGDRRRCELTAVSVAPALPVAFPVPGITGAVDPEIVEKVEQDMSERAERFVEDAAGKLSEAGFRTENRILRGHPTEQLLKEGEQGGFDLIALGSLGAGPVRRGLLGSVSDQVVRHARATLVARRVR